MKKVALKITLILLFVINAMYAGKGITWFTYDRFIPFSNLKDMEVLNNKLYLMKGNGLKVYNLQANSITHQFPQSVGETFEAITTDGKYIYMLISSDSSSGGKTYQIIAIDGLSNTSSYNLYYESDCYFDPDLFKDNNITPLPYDIKFAGDKLFVLLAYPYHNAIVPLTVEKNPIHIQCPQAPQPPSNHPIKKDLNSMIKKGDYLYYDKGSAGSGEIGIFSLSQNAEVNTYKIGEGYASYRWINSMAANNSHLFISVGYKEMGMGDGGNGVHLEIAEKNGNTLNMVKHFPSFFRPQDTVKEYLIGGNEEYLEIFNVSDLNNIKKVYSFRTSGYVKKAIAKNSKIYVEENNGVYIFNIYTLVPIPFEPRPFPQIESVNPSSPLKPSGISLYK